MKMKRCPECKSDNVNWVEEYENLSGNWECLDCGEKW
jgi:transcription initiation factor TFIIIB Brf1 subunit/transcription initiation factor TFIIB